VIQSERDSISIQKAVAPRCVKVIDPNSVPGSILRWVVNKGAFVYASFDRPTSEGVAQEQLDRGIVISARNAGSQPRQGQVAFYIQPVELITKRHPKIPIWWSHCAVASSLNLLRATTPIMATFQRMFRETIYASGLRKSFLPATEPTATAPASKRVP
jgi:hypothetical protein